MPCRVTNNKSPTSYKTGMFGRSNEQASFNKRRKVTANSPHTHRKLTDNSPQTHRQLTDLSLQIRITCNANSPQTLRVLSADPLRTFRKLSAYSPPRLRSARRRAATRPTTASR
eukprot:4309101-Pyramimonas_sp.AAC.1